MAQSKPALHRELSVPVRLLDVIGLDGQVMTPLLTPGLQHTPSIFGLHALAEPVNALAAADFWLVSTLCRHGNSPQN